MENNKTLKLRIYSDVHQEFRTINNLFKIGKMDDEKSQILILAGDYNTLKNLKSDIYFNELSSLCQRFRFVIYVNGNHEYYSGKIGEEYIIKNQDVFSKIDNLILLSRHTPSFIVDNYCFIGSTLWTHLGEYDIIKTSYGEGSNDSKRIKQVCNGRFSSLKKSFLNKENTQDFLWIKNENKKHAEFKQVIITHHPPIRIADPEDQEGHYKNFYSNDLIKQIKGFENVKLWIFGHVHLNNVFKQKIENIYFYSNPIGEKMEDDIKNSLIILK